MHRLKCLFLAAVCLCLCFGASAQVSTAYLIGIVEDSSNASIPDANLKLINIHTGTENDSKTNRSGGFVLSDVIPGTYTLRIERNGFATTQVNGIVLNIGDTKNLIIRMKIGPVTESVTVDASGLTLNTSDASVSTIVDRKFVANIPLNGRSFQDLISMTPGIVTQSPQAAGEGFGASGDFSVNGQGPESNSFFVDGVSANINSGLGSASSRVSTTGSAAGSTALGTTQTLVSIDALQEFRVLTSSYSAEYGRTPGGQFTFLTRSGTDRLHGSLYEYFRNDAFDAKDWFSRSYPLPIQFRQNDFGGTAGMPITLPGDGNLHKTFLFASYEGLFLAQSTPPTTSEYVPSDEVREQAQSAIFPVLNDFPEATSPEISDSAGHLTGLAHINFQDYSLPSHVNSTGIRLDHNFAPRLSTFLRFSDSPSYSQSRQLWSLSTNHFHIQTWTFGANNQLSGTKNNEFRFGLVNSSASENTAINPYLQAPFSNLGPPVENLNDAMGIPGSYARVRAEAYLHGDGAGDTDAIADQSGSSLHQWNLRDTFSFQKANHLFKLGIDERHIATTSTPASLEVQADFFTRQSIVDNMASDIVVRQKLPASPKTNEFSIFAQDEWRASQTLTLSLGLRWEINPPPHGVDGNDAYTAKGDIGDPATLTLAPRGTSLWHTGWYNFAPRLGAAWSIDHRPGRELIFRAGGGVFFDTANQPALRAFNGLGFTTTSYSSNTPLPVTSAQLQSPVATVRPYADSVVFAFPSHLQLPYSLQWNLGLEKSLGKNQSATVSYVGADGRRLLQEQRKNVEALNPLFGEVSYFPRGMTSSYDAFQAKFQRSISHGIQTLVSYTWAHSLDYGSTDPLYPLKRGNSDLDVRHNLEAAISWDLPGVGGHSLVRTVTENWGIDGRLITRAGFPVTLLGNLFSDSVTGSRFYNSVDLIPNKPLYVYGATLPGGRMFNGGPGAADPAFKLPDMSSEGDAPRNSLRGFGAAQVNVAIRREFHLNDHITVQFRAETYNLLNHPNFGFIDPALPDLLFGQPTKMLDQSFGSTGSLYQQGGPRQAQFAVKAIF